MRILLPILIASTAFAAPRKPVSPPPAPTEETITKADILATLRHMQALAKEQGVQLDAAKDQTGKLSTLYTSTLNDLSGAMSETVKVQQSLDAEREARAKAEAAEAKERAEKEKERKLRIAADNHVSRIKTWLSVALAGLFVALVQYLPFGIFPQPTGMYLRIGASIAAAGAAWIIVARFV